MIVDEVFGSLAGLTGVWWELFRPNEKETQR